jgi:RNA polymerase sigma-70 factor (ECF subfamily)
MTLRLPGPFQIQAAIAALHSDEGSKDWKQIVLLYDSLIRIDRNPVIRLNRAVAMAEAGFVEPALNELALIQAELEDYQPFHAARADLLTKANQIDAALEAFDTAIKMADNDVDRAFLHNRKTVVLSSK